MCGKDGKKRGKCYRFSNTEGLGYVQVACPLCIWVCCGFRSVLQVKNTKKKAAEEHVLLLKAQNYYFLIQKLSVFPQAFCTFQTLISLSDKEQSTWLSCFHKWLLTHLQWIENQKRKKMEDPFLMLFFRESLLISLGMVPRITNTSIWTKSDVFAHTD